MSSSPSKYALKSEEYYQNFKESIKAKDTFLTYDHKLKVYMKYMGVDNDQYSLELSKTAGQSQYQKIH